MEKNLQISPTLEDHSELCEPIRCERWVDGEMSQGEELKSDIYVGVSEILGSLPPSLLTLIHSTFLETEQKTPTAGVTRRTGIQAIPGTLISGTQYSKAETTRKQ